MQCSKCQAGYDTGDVFCRKCGAPVAQEASFSEVAAPTGQPPVVTTETTLVTINEPAPMLVPQPPATNKRITALTRRVGQALQSEPGKKALRGATALAVAVGVELITQVAGKRELARPRSSNSKLTPPVEMADSLLRAFEEEFSPAAGGTEEIYIHERVYIRRRRL